MTAARQERKPPRLSGIAAADCWRRGAGRGYRPDLGRAPPPPTLVVDRYTGLGDQWLRPGRLFRRCAQPRLGRAEWNCALPARSGVSATKATARPSSPIPTSTAALRRLRPDRGRARRGDAGPSRALADRRAAALSLLQRRGARAVRAQTRTARSRPPSGNGRGAAHAHALISAAVAASRSPQAMKPAIRKARAVRSAAARRPASHRRRRPRRARRGRRPRPIPRSVPAADRDRPRLPRAAEFQRRAAAHALEPRQPVDERHRWPDRDASG